ncbi:MAG: NAD(P)/FAD-dependent oxidoreductase [Oscillospiraceae bacterium]|nr:NAD(P)/FAD-dependent oxidoreductase [Oscillospiraceae bacterium]
MSTNTRAAEAVVVGGGAAGMMAALIAARRGRAVTLVEHQRFCGRKLRITGKGRCNLCNNCDLNSFFQHVPGNPRFLYGALHRFTPADTMAFFEDLGVPLKTERGGRVFPVSDRAHDVANALESALRRAGVRLRFTEALRVRAEAGAVRGLETGEGFLPAGSVLLATGGLSYPGTGSTGDGYRMAAELGHSLSPLRPSLVPLESDDPDCARLQGFSLKNVRLTAFDARERAVYTELGEMLFTHFGVSGPLVLSASSRLRDWSGGPCRLSVDLKPGLDPEQLDQRILRDFEKSRNRDFRNALDELAGRSMIPVLIRRSGIPEETKVHSVTRAQRQSLVRLFKDFSISVTGPRPIAEAIVTAGGVRVGEIDPRTMESKLVRGLYFAGEILDTDAFTGGYNLQIAWSTGHLAGEQL